MGNGTLRCEKEEMILERFNEQKSKQGGLEWGIVEPTSERYKKAHMTCDEFYYHQSNYNILNHNHNKSLKSH